MSRRAGIAMAIRSPRANALADAFPVFDEAKDRGEDLDGPSQEHVAGGIMTVGDEFMPDRCGVILGDDRLDDARGRRPPLRDESLE